jgi:UDP-glucose 4-epimerase
MRTLITGGAGFIGSHLSDALLAAGHHVLILDNLSTGSFENIAHLKGHDRFEYFIDSVENERLLAELVDRSDVVFHLAAAVGVKLIVEQPVATIETNVRGYGGGTEARQQEEEAGRHRVDVGGVREEQRRPVPRGVRTRAWPDDETPLGLCVQQGDRRVSRARLLEGAQAPDHHRAVLQHRRATPDGTIRHGDPQLRPSSSCGRTDHRVRRWHAVAIFTHVADVVGALIKLVDEPAAIGQVINIGNTQEITIRALAERVRSITGSSSPITLIPYEEAHETGFEDMPRRVPDLSKVSAMIGYAPKHDLEDILVQVIDDFRRK